MVVGVKLIYSQYTPFKLKINSNKAQNKPNVLMCFENLLSVGHIFINLIFNDYFYKSLLWL
jgi:hypothetical protein